MVFMPSQNACGGCPSNNVSFQTQVQNDDNSQTGVMVDSVQDVQDPTEAFSTTSSTDIVGEAVQQGFDSFSSDAD